MADSKYNTVPSEENQRNHASHHATTTTTAAVAVAVPSSSSSKNQLEIVAAEPPTWSRGEVQPPAFRDKWFAIAFLLHMVTVISAVIAFYPNLQSLVGSDNSTNNNADDDAAMADDKTDDDDGFTAGWFFTVFGVALVGAPVLSMLVLGVMSRNAKKLLEGSLIFSIAINVILMLVELVAGIPGGALMHAIMAALLVWYSKSVWHRIPYAASNLKAAVTVIRLNGGITLVSLGSLVVLCVWTIAWTVAFAGATLEPDLMTTKATEHSCDANGNCVEPGDSQVTTLGGVLYCLFLLSFYWTHENVVRTTVAGTVGTWIFSPTEASSFCSSGVTDSLTRSTTYSLGSICFGSLIVAVLQLIRSLLHSSARNRRNGILSCIAQCLLAFIERLVRYFNKWAFVYVGLYGYSYIEAGKSVMELFQARGWSAIISDNLINRLLSICILVIGLLTGVASTLVSFIFEEAEHSDGILLPGFLTGLLIGMVMASLVLGVVSSAVDAIIVCFAEAPGEFKENHPAIAQEMQMTWDAAWPTVDFHGVAMVSLDGGPGIV
eukprot:scaffold36176_cov48-Attheya_sp.AAC.2